MIHKQRFTFEKLQDRLLLIQPLAYRRQETLPPFRYQALEGPTADRPTAPPPDASAWEEIPFDSYWGPGRTNFVLATTFTISNDWPENATVALYLPLGVAGDFSHPEALVYIDGTPYATCDRHHQEILLKTDWHDGQSHQLLLHGWTGLSGFARGEPGSLLQMRPCQVVTIDQPTRDFITSARVTLGVIETISAQDPAHGKLLNALDAAFQLLDTRQPFADRFYDSVPAAHARLSDGIAAAGAPLDVNIFAAGHAHIDVAWLWTLGQTRRKTERTFHTVLRLMEQFPDYQFTQSQPQLYAYALADQPELFSAIQQRVQDGRWEVTGGMWVEADCNLSGAESLARQFLLGRTFFRDHFGADAESPILWLPDVFGYAWNLPQLIKEAGLDYFFTIKIGWSQYNRMPYDSFWWQGLDGTRVLTHFSPSPEASGDSRFASTYNAKAVPADIIGTWTNFQQKEQSQDLLMSFGYGDGGGGPTREMLENIREMAAFPSAPHIKHSKAIDFFRALEANAGDQLPVWNGELYLEYHRGTYTTHARNKRANRQSEFLLHDAEFLAAYASVLSNRLSATGNQPAASGTHSQLTINHLPFTIYHYPHEPLTHAWQLICLNQFHDIIPGSSIQEVYVESLAQYAEIRTLGEQVRDDALTYLASAFSAATLAINPTSFPQRQLLTLPAAATADDRTHVQKVEDGFLVDAGELPPYSVTAVSPQTLTTQPAQPLTVTPHLLENNYLRVELDDNGDITRLYDKQQGREVLPPGALTNQFQAFEDRPGYWDAWDIQIYYDDRMWLAAPATAVRVAEMGPLRATLEIQRQILNSTYTQRISLCHHSPRLDFHTDIDWQERAILLKVAFPVDVMSPTATYDIQWGNVTRPTHRNTSWDWAKFETCAQKWVDLSEGDYGLSLLNDCKYGHDIRDYGQDGGVIRLSLLRGPSRPDPTADLGRHQFAYSLLPHAGSWDTETLAQAYAFNNPPFVFATLTPPDVSSVVRDTIPAPVDSTPLVQVDNPHVIIETIKQAEDDQGIIVRLYESHRSRGPVKLTTALPLAGAWRANLLEENQEALAVSGNEVHFSIRPYQIITLRLQLEGT